MTQPAVSVVIPAYNTAAFIGDTLSSVRNQTFQDYEIIVVNDGSPDTAGLEDAIAPYRDSIRYLVQENRGLSGARNTGIAAARADLIALVDSDDIWEPDYLEYQLAFLRSRPDLAVVYPDATTFGDPMREGRSFMAMHPSSGPVTFESLVRQECNVMVSVLARRDVLVAAGLFDESLRSSEDFDLWLRVVQGGWGIGYHRRSLVRSRLHAGSLSADRISMCRHIVRVLDKVESHRGLTAPQRALVAERRTHFAALLRLHEGRKAFFAGDYKEAVRALTDANAHLRRRKIGAALVMLQLMPRLLLRAYDIRDRLVFRASTR
jgi:glycosyltransferase involved in cell wall biosynthesis